MTLTINGIDPRTVGLIVADVVGWSAAASQSRAAVAVPRVPGLVATQTEPEERPRRLLVRGIVEGATVAACRANLDTIVALLARAPLTVVFADDATRALTAELESLTAAPGAAQMIERKLLVEIGLVCRDPFRYDVSQSAVALTSANALLPLGTARVRPVITVTGASTNPLVTLYQSDGVTVAGTVGYTGSTIAGDSLVIDCAALTLKKNGVSVIASLTGDFLTLDVAVLGTFESSAWPRMKIDGLTGGTAQCAYKKAWR